MPRYTIEHCCGHEQDHDVLGRRADRERKVAWLETTQCSECYREQIEKEREQAAQEAKAQAEEIGLPDLTGSVKQVRWAMQIRDGFIGILDGIAAGKKGLLSDNIIYALPVSVYNTMREELRSIEDSEEKRAIDRKIRDGIYNAGLTWAASILDAHKWIDSRNEIAHHFAKDAQDEILAVIRAAATGTSPEAVEEALQQLEAQKQAERELQEQAAEEATLYPEEQITSLIAEIKITESIVSMRFPEANTKVNSVVKELGYSWERPVWKKDFRVMGSLDQRAAEVCHKLLKRGVPVRCYNVEVRRRAVEADYEPEPSVWVTKRREDINEYPGWFSINWNRDCIDFYSTARSVSGARWAKPTVVAPPESWEDIIGLEEAHGVKILPPALQLIKKQRAKEMEKITVNPEEAPEGGEVNTSRPILTPPTNAEIDPDLLDD